MQTVTQGRLKREPAAEEEGLVGAGGVAQGIRERGVDPLRQFETQPTGG
jgi:hypothetical protein